MQALPRLGVGLAFQAPLAGLIERAGDDLDFVEVVPDMLWHDLGPGSTPRYVDDRAGCEALLRAAAGRPVVPHGIGLSIGSAHRFEVEHLEQLARWSRRMPFHWHSDHLAFHLVEYDGRVVNAGITLPLPRDRATLELLVPRIARVRATVEAPFLLENNVYYFDVTEPELDEATFLNTVCRESGCGLLLDLHNLYTNARNHGFDAQGVLAALDLGLVGEIHVAGGMELDGYWLDAHSGLTPEPVWSMLEWVLPRCPNLGGVVFELFGSWYDTVGEEALRAELARLQQLWRNLEAREEATA